MNMSRNMILPAAVRFQSGLLANVSQLNDVLGKDAGKYSEAQVELIKKAGQLIQDLHGACDQLESLHDKAESGKTQMVNARMFAEKVVPSMEHLAGVCGALEMLVDDADWPLPKFSELLFTR